MAYTMDTTVGEILKDTKALEVLDKHVPGASKNPMLGFVSGMTLKALAAMPQAQQLGVTEELVNKFLLEVNARK